MLNQAFYPSCRALARKCSTKEEESILYGISRAELAVDNSLGEKAEEHFANMAVLITK